jgi:hypothetical protein
MQAYAMRDACEFAPPELREKFMRRSSLGLALLTAAVLAALAAYIVPHGLDARAQLAIADDPARIAERALDEKFNAGLAEREIDAALAAGDADLAQSFVELAAARHVALPTALVAKVKTAVAEDNSVTHTATRVVQGFITGEPDDMASLVGTTLGDLFVFGDLRDAAREGSRLALGEKADTMILGLACVGLAITAGTYATLGAEAPVRIGLSLAKAARKTGRLSAKLAGSVGHMMRGAVDWGRLKTAVKGASIAEPALAIHAAREAIKVERAGGLLHLARDIGRVEAKAGARASLDGLKVAENPREMSRIAKLAEKEGGKTRAILKVAGRGAIMLSLGAFDLAWWIVGALITVLALVSSLKNATERAALRIVRHRKERHRRKQVTRLTALTAAPGLGGGPFHNVKYRS